jgi:hypothetical protein
MQLATSSQLKTKKYQTRKIGDKEIAQIIALNSGGYYAAEIAEMTGRSVDQIETALWNEGITARCHKYEAEEAIKWVQMYTGQYDGEPWSFAEIQRETGYSYGTIQLAVLRAGVRDRHPNESRRLARERKKKKTRRH